MSEQQTPQPLQAALDRLLGVQLIDNTVQDAREARQELRDIITDLYAAATRAAYEDAAQVCDARAEQAKADERKSSGVVGYTFYDQMTTARELAQAIRARAEAK